MSSSSCRLLPSPLRKKKTLPYGVSTVHWWVYIEDLPRGPQRFRVVAGSYDKAFELLSGVHCAWEKPKLARIINVVEADFVDPFRRWIPPSPKKSKESKGGVE